jgi:alpha-galactosidase
MAIYLNTDVIAVDQDPLGVQGQVVETDGTHLVFAKALAGGDVAVALFNEDDVAVQMSTTAAAVGLGRAPAYGLRNLWSKHTTETAGTIVAWVPAHATAIYRVSKTRRWASVSPATAMSFAAAPAYPGGPVVATPGAPAALTTTFISAGHEPVTRARVTLSLPPGWTAPLRGPPWICRLGADRTLIMHWALTPAADAAPGSYPLTATARYRWRHGRRRATSTATLQVLVPSPPTSTRRRTEILRPVSSSGG